MAIVRIIGRHGRLGNVLARSLQQRQDRITDSTDSKLDYLIFAQRYRGAYDFIAEMDVNLRLTCETIERTQWTRNDATNLKGHDNAICIVGSIAGTDPQMQESIAYNLSKAALEHAARFYAMAFAGSRIRCNVVAPATFRGPDSRITEQQVVDVILWLCSPQSSGVNGQTIRVTG
jgi:NAD(P)-dependent dehydrogenase (short-subunit alcohol dehydrogenase family)